MKRHNRTSDRAFAGPRRSVAEPRRALAWLAAGVVLVSPAIPAAQASPTGDGVVIDEVYARGGSADSTYSSKYVELYNPTGSPASLDGMTLAYWPVGRSAASAKLTLTGSIAPGGRYVVAAGSNGTGGEQLPKADAAAPFNLAGASGSVLLVTDEALLQPNALQQGDVAGAEGVVDAVGWGSATVREGSPAPGGVGGGQSVGRADGADTNDNGADFAAAAPSPGLATGASPSPSQSPDPGASPSPSQSSSPEHSDQPSPETSATPQPDAEAQTVTPIADIQGPGSESPLAGQTVTTRGVVTAAYPSGGFNGAYIQTPGTGGANDDGISDGLFVHSSKLATSVQIGDYVEVTGKVSEYNGMTQVSAASFSTLDGQDVAAPQPVTLERLPADDAGKEALEGMLVDISGPMTVTNNYDTNRYGQVGLAFGTEPLRQPSDAYNPSRNPDEIAALEADNAAREITLDDGLSWSYTGANNSHPEVPLPYVSKESPLRVGAAATLSRPVVLDYRHQWNLQPVAPVTSADGGDRSAEYATFTNTRTEGPKDVGGNVSVSSFNVLNYFTDLGQGEAGCQAYTDREGTPVTARNCDVRGAYTREAFERQQAKIVAAINRLDASIVSLEEIETSSRYGHGRDESIAALVTALNEDAGYDKWAYVPSPAALPASEDAIRLAFIYQKGQVAPAGESRILIGDRAFTGYAREPLAQSWRGLDGAGNAVGEEFTVVVNHFKSKGSLSKAYDDDTDPYQGNNNKLRTAQAQALASWIEREYPGKPVFVVGDLNSYSAEDPILTLKDAGYAQIAEAFGVDGHSYQYGGRVGSLDHALANERAMAMVTGADVWNVNAMESIALEYSRHNYNVKDLWDAGPYRSSDHDPVKFGLRITPAAGDGAKPAAEPCVAEATCNVYFVDDFATHIATLGMKLAAGDAIAGDWDGDGVDTLAVRDGERFTFYSGNRSDAPTSTVAFEGSAGGQVLAGDFNGDGRDEIAVKHGNVFAIRYDLSTSGPAQTSLVYGRAGDAGLAGDWNGDGRDTFGVRRGNQVFLRDELLGGNADVSYVYGHASDVGLAGDFDGDGRDSVAVRRGNLLLVKNALTGGQADLSFRYGRASDEVVFGDWNGDRADTPAAVRR
ncbi:MAG: ExeM/NucH family extracellular endonuclease [Actinomycetaceae bacterium]|nr:ExeM/NucH family extracellular endonuclease [Actinomycetaceae bacterium]